jgi:hypothetical protein
MLPLRCLSECAECSATELAEGAFGDAVAECIRCGKTFLLPLTRTIVAPDAINTPVHLNAAAVTDDTASARHSTRRAILSVLFSVFVNATALWLLAVLYIHISTESQYAMDATLSKTDDEAFIILPDFDAGSPPPEKALLQSTIVITELTVTDVGPVVALDGSQAAGKGQSGGGNGNGRGGRGTGIFGGVSSAKSFAYVVDASGSMSGPRMRLVLNELRHSISALKEEQSFFVVFFNQHTFPMMWPKIEKELIQAHAVNKDRVIEWALKVEPNEATMPEQALRMALDLEPDIVFFLTDGDISGGALRIVKKYREKHTSVHTICVGEEAAVPVMQQIAIVGNGEFLMVSESNDFE